MSWDWDKLKEQQQKQSDIPPQLNDLFNKLNNMKLPGGSILIIVALLIFLGSTMVYTVDVEEVGIVQRFGKYVRKEPPGLRIKLPAGIEKVTKVKVRRVLREEFGFSSAGAITRSRYGYSTDHKAASLMLTGDLNVALVPWIVQYKIEKPEDFLFKVENVRQLLRDMSEAAMRLVVGDRSINEVITKREEIAEEAKGILQKELDQAQAGIRIVTIEMKRTNVPEPVQPSFNEVNQSVQEKEKMIYQANEAYNKAIPAARGEADKIIMEAQGYKTERINEALGDVARFKAIMEEYQKAKEVTRKRLYLEMLKDVFSKVDRKYIIDSDQKNLLPLLNLEEKSGIEK